MDVRIARTAHLFHVVDQLSAWDQFCHSQYARHFGALSEQDRALLAKHAELRKRRGWGGGLEQALYTDAPLDVALRALPADEAAVEREVLGHFAARVDALLERERATLEAFQARLAAESGRIAEFARRCARFFGSPRVDVPVFLIADPDDHDCGGGYNGGRLTLEVPRKDDVFPIFLHEIFHAFIETRRPLLERSKVDYQTLNEGLAYALSPGLIHAGSGDPLAADVAADAAAGKTLADAFARFHRYGLALRPLLKEALDDPRQTLETFLPRAADVWRALAEVEAARGSTYRLGSLRSLFIFGEEGALYGRFTKAQDRHVFQRGHSAGEYDEMFDRHTKSGDTVALLLTLDGPRVPAKYADLLPKPWAEIEAALKKGETVEAVHPARDLRVVVLAAPTKAALNRLEEETQLVR